MRTLRPATKEFLKFSGVVVTVAFVSVGSVIGIGAWGFGILREDIAAIRAEHETFRSEILRLTREQGILAERIARLEPK